MATIAQRRLVFAKNVQPPASSILEASIDGNGPANIFARQW